MTMLSVALTPLSVIKWVTRACIFLACKLAITAVTISSSCAVEVGAVARECRGVQRGEGGRHKEGSARACRTVDRTTKKRRRKRGFVKTVATLPRQALMADPTPMVRTYNEAQCQHKPRVLDTHKRWALR